MLEACVFLHSYSYQPRQRKATQQDPSCDFLTTEAVLRDQKKKSGPSTNAIAFSLLFES
jgi:hypothetical protein